MRGFHVKLRFISPFIKGPQSVCEWPAAILRYSRSGCFLWLYLSSFCISVLLIRSCRKCIRRAAEKSPNMIAIDKSSIFLGQILHIRHFPALHSFCYSYLMVGVPITYDGKLDSAVISMDSGASSNRCWLRVEANDHLGRGGNTGSAEEVGCIPKVTGIETPSKP